MTKIVEEYERSYCSEPKLEQIGVILHCYMCKNNSYIYFNCCDNPKIYTDEKNIICVSCKKILPNTSENDMKIFKDKEKIIASRNESINYLLHEYAYNLEIRELKKNIKRCIIEIIKIFVINIYIYKTIDIGILLIPNNYILQRIFDIFGIKIDLKLYYSEFLHNEYENSFIKLIKNSINDIEKILDKYDDNNYISDDDDNNYISDDDVNEDDEDDVDDEDDDDNEDDNNNNEDEIDDDEYYEMGFDYEI